MNCEPIEIVFSGSTVKKITYIYNSSGVKLKKVITNGSAITNVDYLGGFQYKQTGTGTVYLEFFPHSEGYVSVTTSGTTLSYNYVFNYQDHLGNNRLSYTLNPSTNALTILEENHYYPFGFKHNNYNIDQEYYDSVGGVISVAKGKVVPYKYKYNGKEYQDELGLNFYDYGARNYDAALGRWMNIDPLADKYYSLGPYLYVADNPMAYIDPNGKEIIKPSEKFNSSELKQVFNDLLNNNSAFKSALGNFKDSKNLKFKLNLDVDKSKVPNGKDGFTVYKFGTYNGKVTNVEATIYFRPGAGENLNNLGKAVLIIHEYFHAYLGLKGINGGDDEKHEVWDKHIDLIQKAIQEYSDDNNLNLTKSQIYELSIYGADIGATILEEYIQNVAAKAMKDEAEARKKFFERVDQLVTKNLNIKH